jgi:hypothetical protein
MSGGTRPCYFNGTTKEGDKWYCKKCVRVRARAQARTRHPKSLSKKDLKALYLNVMNSKAKGELDIYTARGLVFEIMPILLRDLFHLRGMKEPKKTQVG